MSTKQKARDDKGSFIKTAQLYCTIFQYFYITAIRPISKYASGIITLPLH